MTPKVSIIIPCFNDGAYLAEAVASAQANQCVPHEVIIVNDGSTDPATLAVLQSWRDHSDPGNVRVLDQPNCGPGAARNRGIAIARGCYILPLDADNHIRPEYIDCGIKVLDSQPAVDVVYGDADYFGERTGSWIVPEFDLRRLLEGNYIDNCAVYRRSAWERCGGYDDHLLVRGCEDWDFWLRVALTGGQFHHIAKPLFEYRVRADSLTSKVSGVAQFEAARRYIHSKQIELPISEYVELQSSIDFALVLMRRRPIHTILRLFGRTFLPFLFKPLASPFQPSKRSWQVRNLSNAQN